MKPKNYITVHRAMLMELEGPTRITVHRAMLMEQNTYTHEGQTLEVLNHCPSGYADGTSSHPLSIGL
jgi:hypothetical protein